MMSVHDALEAWQAGEITSRRAMSLTGAGDILELYAVCHSCDVDIRMELLPDEAAAVDAVSAAIDRAFARNE